MLAGGAEIPDGEDQDCARRLVVGTHTPEGKANAAVQAWANGETG